MSENLQIRPAAKFDFSNIFPYSILTADDALVTNRSLKRVRWNARGDVQFRTNRGIWVNSALRKDEWEELDAEVVMAAGPRTGRIARMPQQPLGGIGTLVSQWNVSSQMTAAQASISGRSRGEQDRADYSLAGVPIPVVWKEFHIGERELAASRNAGDGIDRTSAFEAGRVVAEKTTDMLFNGAPEVVLNASTVVGFTTHANRNTGTAAGDFGTIANIRTTVINMINAAAGDNYHGPFVLDVATTQYIEMLARYTDGSGQTALETVEALPQIDAVLPSDQLTAGSLTLTQNTRNVQDWAEAMAITLVEWMSGDGMTHLFRVMTIAAPRIKADYATQSGIVHYTGA